MRERQPPAPSRSRSRVLARNAWIVLASGAIALAGCPLSPPAPRDGVRPWEARALVPVPGGVVNAAGGGLVVVRSLLSIDTRLGPMAISAIHHSASGTWYWSFEPRLLDGVFHDGSGVSYDVAALPAGAVVPGTDWVKLDATRMKTRGGLVHEFDGAGRLSGIHWSSDAYPCIRHVAGVAGAEVRTVAIEQCTSPGDCEPVYALTWDAEARLVAVDDRAGRRAELDWDAAGRLVAARDAGDVASSLPGDRYDWQGSKLVSLTRSDGEIAEYAYVDGRVAAAVAQGPGTPTYAFSYVRMGAGANVTTHVDPTGVRREIEWDDSGRVLRRAWLEAGATERFQWSGLREVWHERSDGTVLERSFSAETLVSETLPDGNVREYQWNPNGVNRLDPFAGAPTEVRDPLGVQLAVTYDVAGRPLELTNGAGETTRLVWTGIRLDSIEPPSGTVQRFEGYGEHGAPTVIRQGGEIVDEPVYDAVGNRLRGQDLGDPTASSTPGVFERHFDADRRVVQLVLAEDLESPPHLAERLLTVVRRADGRVARIERPYGGDTEYLYDDLGLLAERRERVDGDWRSTFYRHDAAGRRISEEKPNGMRREWGHDGAGRLRTTTTLRHSVVETVATSTWDGARLVAVHDSVRDASELYAYDAAGRIDRVVHAGGESSELNWDARSRLAGITFRMPGGQTLSTLAIERDAADREATVRAAGVVVLERAFADGRLAETRYGNGLTRAYAYGEGSDRWIGAQTTAADGSFVASTEWTAVPSPHPVFTLLTRTADPLGLVPDPPPGSGAGEVRTEERYWLHQGSSFERPHGLRLLAAVQEGSLPTSGFTLYDALGSRRKVHQPEPQGAVQFDFSYNPERNRLLAVDELRWNGSAWSVVGVRSYAYDEAGYVTSLDGTEVQWTAAGRIAAVGGVASFAWDALGRPLSRTVLGEETDYWFGGLMEAPRGSAPTALDLGEVRLDLAGGAHLYRHMDPRHNVKFVTDAAGVVVAHHVYSAYGRVVTHGPSSDARGLARGTHAGGLVVLGARVLDPGSGRFLSPDPVDPWLDAYAYAWGNPVHLWDPGGLQAAATPGAPPLEVTLIDALGSALIPIAAALFQLPTPIGPVLGTTAALLGGTFKAAAIVARDRAARRGRASGPSRSVPSIPPVSFATDLEPLCVDGVCITVPDWVRSPDRSPEPAPGPGAGLTLGSGFGVDLGSSGCSAPSGVCGLGPELVVLLPWLLRRRARRARI